MIFFQMIFFNKKAINVLKISRKISLCLCVFVAIISCKNTKTEDQKVDSVALKALEKKIKLEINADQKAAFIDQIMQHKADFEGFNGNILVAQKDVIVYQKSFGFANFEDTIKLNSQSKFQLASLSKTFTAVATMQLAQEGKISLENTVKDFYPKFPYDGITIRSMLSHRSGLPFYQYTFDKYVRANDKYPTNQEMMQWFEIVQPTPPVFNLPDHFFAYNNTNFAILAAIVEKVSGLSFDVYVREKIFKPARMKNSFIATTKSDSINQNRTIGYQFGRRLSKDFYDNITGDKGVYSTTEDLFNYYKALKINKLVNKEFTKEMWTPRSFERPGLRNYGYGFRLWVTPEQKTDYIYHTGWWKGYNTIMFFSLQDDFVIIALGNKYNRSVYQIKEIVDILHGGAKLNSMEENILDE